MKKVLEVDTDKDKDLMKIPGEDLTVYKSMRGFIRKQSCQHLDFRAVRQGVSVVKAAQVVGFVTSALAN